MKTKIEDELRPEYTFDYSKAVQGKYVKRLMEEGANVAVLEPEVAGEIGQRPEVRGKS